jgi:endonuclease/exonuclease/phosphatase family metal-dependent hydrolase
MPYYHYLRNRVRDRKERARVIDNLRALQAQLDEEVPTKDAGDHLLLATFNCRDFGKPGSRRGFGRREAESHHYLAEIISRFDLIAVQEVNELKEWETVMDLLGPDWDYLATDVTDPKLGGNGERLLYCYDKRKVWFKKIAGEIVLPTNMLISKAVVPTEDNETKRKLYTGKQFRRTPFVASFQSGWFKFDICTVHLYYGAESGSKLNERVEEIDRVARYFGGRAKKALKDDKALILLGDFNIVHPDHETMGALIDAGFVIPSALNEPTNYSETKYYDQIAFMTKDEVIEFIDKKSTSPKNRNAGVLDIFKCLYTPDQWRDYIPQMQSSPNGKGLSEAQLRKYFKQWMTYQLSDHRPMWVRLKTNDSATYLETMRKEALKVS